MAEAMATKPTLTVVLSDSTGYGWLADRQRGAALVVRSAGTVAAIVCGGSLVQPPGPNQQSILDVFFGDWVLLGGVEAVAPETEVAVAVVPARHSVPGRDYEGLAVARAAFRIKETTQPILVTTPAAYGQKKALHFMPQVASEAFESVVNVAVTELEQQCHRVRPWVAVVVCAGWNCGEATLLRESYLVAQMGACQRWLELLCVMSAQSACRLPWTTVAKTLGPAPLKLFQTNKEDHDGARRNMATYAPDLQRIFVDDPGCRADLVDLGGEALVAKSLSWSRMSHRADLWRYVRLAKEGGSYLDIKMCLLQSLQTTLAEVYAQANGAPEGQRVAQSQGKARLEDTPHLIMSRGANQQHIYQGNILCCSAGHPLLRRAIADCMGTTEAQLVRRYLRFCEFLWREVEKDLGRLPEVGWNFTKSYGPIYLFEERLVKTGSGKKKVVTLDDGEPISVDGHFMLVARSETMYAATRAWGWRHGFKEVALAGLAAAKLAATEQSVAQPVESEEVEQSVAQSAIGAAQSVAQPASSSGVDQSVAQATGAAVTVEIPPGATSVHVSRGVLLDCQRIVEEVSHYSDLVPDEVATLVALGLRPATSKDNYLTCIFCKNRRRKEKKFQGFNEVRQHFQQNHGRGDDAVEMPGVADGVATEAMSAEMEPMEPVGCQKKK